MRHFYVSLDKKVNVINHIKYQTDWNYKPYDLSGLFAQYTIPDCATEEDTQVTQAS